MIKNWSLSAWTCYPLRAAGGDFKLIRIDFDWHRENEFATYTMAAFFNVSVSLLGFNASLTHWPKGKS